MILYISFYYCHCKELLGGKCVGVGARGCLIPCFVRQLHEWEFERMDEFLLRLQTKALSKNGGDRVVCLGLKSGMFYSKILIHLFDHEEI